MTEQAIEQDLWNEFETELKKKETTKINWSENTPIESKNIQKFFQILMTEQFPEGSINKTLEKNFAVYIIQNELPIEQIKAKYSSQGWAVGGLLGWIKKVLAGEIKELNVGELVNWCKENKIELLDLFFDEKEQAENPYNNLFYETKHLPHFETFDSLIGLYGKQYLGIKKARWYQLLGGILQKKIRLGKTETDTRMQVMYPLPTEAGKNALIYSIKQIIKSGIRKNEDTLFKFSEPISYSPESLVGKYVEREIPNPDCEDKKRKTIKQRIENKGHFNSDFLELDECSKLIIGTEKEETQAREYFSKSENSMGYNEVEKRLVDDLETEVVHYFPTNTNSFYFQPHEKLPENIMTQGFMRRKIIPIGNIKNFLIEVSEKLLDYKLEAREENKQALIDAMVDYVEKVRESQVILGKNQDFVFTEEAKELIKKYSMIILDCQGAGHSIKISNFCKLNKNTTIEYLIKMSCILAGAYNSTIVNEQFVSLAFMDLTEFMQNTYDFIYYNVKGTFDYGTSFRGAKYYDIKILKFLHEKEAHSFETSNITIADFLKKIQEVYPNDIGEEMAHKHYRRMKNEENWIDSSQKGSHDSRVWLKFNPKIQEELNQGDKGSKGWNEYNLVKTALFTILDTLQPR